MNLASWLGCHLGLWDSSDILLYESLRRLQQSLKSLMKTDRDLFEREREGTPTKEFTKEVIDICDCGRALIKDSSKTAEGVVKDLACEKTQSARELVSLSKELVRECWEMVEVLDKELERLRWTVGKLVVEIQIDGVIQKT